MVTQLCLLREIILRVMDGQKVKRNFKWVLVWDSVRYLKCLCESSYM
jgi:hypothetical protein